MRNKRKNLRDLIRRDSNRNELIKINLQPLQVKLRDISRRLICFKL